MFFFLPAVPSNEADESQLEEYLKKKGFPYGKTAFAAAASMLALALAAFFLLLGQMPAAALSICIAPALYALVSYAASRGTAESEQFLPDALYSAASTHKLLSAEKMLAFLSRGGFGRLSEAFGLALRRQKAGESFAASMAAAARFCPSPLVRRSFSLLVVCYETGANMYFALREAASDVVSFFSLVRERAALLAIQRYTVLAASALLVPLILGTVASLAPALSSPSILSSGAASAPLSSLTAACQLYLIINSALSALLLSFAETSPGRAALYFALSAPISQLVFALAASGSLSLA